jgi:hypothetical protein
LHFKILTYLTLYLTSLKMATWLLKRTPVKYLHKLILIYLDAFVCNIIIYVFLLVSLSVKFILLKFVKFVHVYVENSNIG